MAINNFRFNLDIEKEDYIPKLKIKQYDTAIFYVNLFKNSSQFSVSNETIKMFVRKTDGNVVYQEDGITLDGSTIKINVNNQSFTCSGLTYAELELKSSDGQVTSSTFLYEVKEKVGSDKAIESVTDIATLDKLKKYMEDAKKELEKFKNDFSKIEDLVANKDKLEGQNEDAKKNIVELGKVLEDANNITSDEGKYITGNNVVSESTNGYIQDLKLYGKSAVNRFRFRSQGVVNTNLYVYSKESPSDNTTGGKNLRIFNNTGKNIVVDINSNGVYKRSIRLTSIEKFKDVTLSNEEYLYCFNALTSDGWHSELESDRKLLKNSCIVVDDFTVENIDTYFEGIASVGNGYEIEVLSTNSNLFDGELRVAHLEGGKNIYREGTANTLSALIKIPVGGTYYCKCEGGTRNIVGYFKDKPKPGEAPLKVGVDTITVDGSGYLVFYMTNQSNITYPKNIMVNFGNIADPYITHKQDKKTILFKDSDNKWKTITNLTGYWENGKFIWGDTIEQHSDGKYYYHKRGFDFILNGSEAWGDNGTPQGGCSTFYIRGFSGISKFKILCDKFNYNISPMLSTVGISSQSNILYLTVKTDYASNVTELKNKLKIDNIRLVFEDIEKIYECLDISTRAFRNKTMLSIYSGAIDPGISYYVPTGFLSADNSISEKVETLDKYSEKNTKDINDLTSNIENNYFNINRRLLTDFNNGTQEGKYYLHSSSLIPNSPPTSTTGLYGIVEVLYKNENELFQFVTLHSGESWLRFRNGHGDWDKWHKLVTQDDFPSNIDSQGTGYQYLPNGMLMQWGTTTVTFDSVKGSAIIRYPVTYKAYCKCTGNLESNDYGSYSETNAVVGGQTLSQGFCEVRDINGSSRAGKIARVTWIVIGR
ncbi:hypothetical protein J0A94_03835 [Paraclostridium bifermentans]|uniref:BppU N-terminal domain-containing protein n=1 Tax=Paraclostridium bifermentans TaxID=1490 RepID=A0AA44IGN1_PARBF|nr:BppU family phage baseplate upper protein [Paraclostridium bifermentans]MBN8046947.1 hypothetical protein [Paraclostridium bifermentans]NME08981.1 hypothetical protein [Paraclostridium bifermentans]